MFHEEVTHCEHCGEPFDGDDQAEVIRPSDPRGGGLLVHSEPCAMELLSQGWELA